jgi:hypothetical protein
MTQRKFHWRMLGYPAETTPMAVWSGIALKRVFIEDANLATKKVPQQHCGTSETFAPLTEVSLQVPYQRI